MNFNFSLKIFSEKEEIAFSQDEYINCILLSFLEETKFSELFSNESKKLKLREKELEKYYEVLYRKI